MRILILLIAISLSLTSSFSQEQANQKNINSNEKQLRAKEALSKIPHEQRAKSLKPRKSSEEKLNNQSNSAKEKNLYPAKSKKKQKEELNSQSDLPSEFYVPGEFDECSAVFISWPSYAFDSNNQPLEPFTPGYGFNQSGGISEIAGWIADLFEDSPYPVVWAKMASAISQEAKCYIRLSNLADSSDIVQYIYNQGYELINYQFISNPDGENAFWARDFGPYGIYTGSDDKLAFIDATYYPDRPIDNDFNIFLGKLLGVPVFQSDVETEGGNFMTDGYNHGFYSDIIFDNNADTLGPAFDYKAPWTKSQVNSEMKSIFSLDTAYVLPHLNCDGGTGHIDMYIKLIDDETIIMTQLPNDYNKSSFTDWQIYEKNFNYLKSLKSVYNRPFRILRMPLPTSDNGKYTRTTCNTYKQDARGYINGLTINRTFLMPSYSNDTSGNVAQDNAAMAQMQKYMPGTRIVPIDSRCLTQGGGAIHCITMQIPAGNPVQIWHPSIRDFQPLQQNYAINAKIRTNSGVKSVTCNWRNRKDGIWRSNNLELNNSVYTSLITNNGFVQNDTIDYYLSVETNNGKKITKPIAAPAGYFSFYFSQPSAVEELSEQSVNNYLSNAYPNPFGNLSSIQFSIAEGQQIKLAIYNSVGEQIKLLKDNYLNAGTYHCVIDLNGFPAGIYYCRLITGNYSEMKKLFKVE